MTAHSRQRSSPAASPGEVRRFEHPAAVVALSLVPDVRYVITFAEDDTVRVWDAGTGRLVRQRKLDRGTSGVAISYDGRSVLVDSQAGPLELVDIETGRVVRRFGDVGAAAVCALSPDGSRALTVAPKVPKAGSRYAVRMWDVTSGRELRRFDGHGDDPITCLAVSPDGTRVLAGGGAADYGEHAVVGWELDSGRELARPHRPMMLVNSVAFSPDARHAAAGSNDCSISVWEVVTGRDAGHLASHTGNVLAVAFSPDGRRLLSGSGSDFLGGTGLAVDNTVRVWDVDRGRELFRFEGHTRNVNSVAFSPDGRHAISGSSDHTVRLWRMPA